MNNAAITSQSVKAAFNKAGIKVRVRDFAMKFRVCPTVDGVKFDKEAVLAVAVELGLTDTCAKAGGQFNTGAEFIGYKPGKIVSR